MRDPQCLVLSLDFDGCSDNSSSQQAIIKHVSEVYTQFPSIKKVVFMIGSLRQSLRLDITNAIRNSTYPDFKSCTLLQDEMVPRLTRYLDTKHPDHGLEIIFDTFLQADIYAELDEGTSFNAMKHIFAHTDPAVLMNIESVRFNVMVKNPRGEDIELMHAPHLADSSKITMIYGQLHHIASLAPDTPILMQFYDDKIDILNGIYRFYRSHSQWIPENISLKLFYQVSLANQVPLSRGEYMSGCGEVNHAYRQTLIRLAQMLSYNSIPVGFPELKDYLEEALKPSLAPVASSTTGADFIETEYGAIVIPDAFDTDDAAIHCYQALLAQGRQILESDIELELEFFNEYLSHLDYFQDNVELYEAVYKKTSILEKPSQTRADFEILNEQENILYQYPRHAFENELEEAEKFAHTRCHFDERVKDFEKIFQAFRDYLCAKISSAMGKTEEEFLRTLEIYKNSSAAVVVAPKPRRATISHSLFEAQSSVEEELLKSLDLSNAP